MLAFGFASGLPLPLTGLTLRQWLSEHGVSLGAIGLTAWIGLSYTLKFLWAPLLDQLRPPPGLRRLGRRRGWLAAIQAALAAALLALAWSDPSHAPPLVAVAVGVAFLSASQDIVVDAWRIETFPQAAQGAAMAAYVWGYRVALLVSGAGALGLAGPLGWHGALSCMAALSALGLAATLLAAEPASGQAAQALAAHAHGAAARLRDAVVTPLREFLSRPGAAEILAFVLLFKLGEALAGPMAIPFYHDMGFDRAQVARALFLPSLTASLAGSAAGGLLVARIGTGRALVATGFAQMATLGLYLAVAASHGDVRVLYAKVLVEGFAESMADAAFIAYLSGLCALAYTATQYALLSSLAVVGVRTLGGLSGFAAQALGWVPFYAAAVLTALPAMLVMLHLLRRFPGGLSTPERPEALSLDSAKG